MCQKQRSDGVGAGLKSNVGNCNVRVSGEERKPELLLNVMIYTPYEQRMNREPEG